MLQKPMDVLTAYPVRKSKKQKQAFRDAVQAYLQTLGYESRVEKGSLGCHNVVFGSPETAQYLITAHYDTCARLPIPNLITPCNLLLFLLYQLVMVAVMLLPPLAVGIWYGLLIVEIVLMLAGPANRHNANDNTSGVVTVLEIARSLPELHRDKVCFVLFDLEEAGLIGSASYRKAHKKATDCQIVLNLDCVGDGDEILFFPTKKLKKDASRMAPLRSCCGQFGPKSVTLREKGFSIYPSDQANFPFGVGICALRRSKVGLYLDKIHTHRDIILEQTNVNLLRAALISMICCNAAK